MIVTGLNSAAKALAKDITLAKSIPPITTAKPVNNTLGFCSKNFCTLSNTGLNLSPRSLKALVSLFIVFCTSSLVKKDLTFSTKACKPGGSL